MTGPLTGEQIEWAAQFCGMPRLAAGSAAPSSLSGATTPMPPPVAPAAGITATAAPVTPPTAVQSPHTIEKQRVIVEADRLHELDDAMPVILDLIKHTEKTTRDLQAVANLHGIDAEKPEEAAQALAAAAPPLDPRDKRELQQALRAVHDQQDVLAGVLIQIQDKSRELLRDLDMLKKQAETKQKDTDEDDEKEKQKQKTVDRGVLAHLYDLVIQVIKFGEDISMAAAKTVQTVFAASLELFGLDLVKDGVKGDDPDAMLVALQRSMTELEGAVTALIKQEIADTKNTLRELLPLAINAHEHFVDDVKAFDGLFKADVAHLPQTPAGNPASPEVLGLMLVYHAVLGRGEAFAAATAAVKASAALRDLAFWKTTLLPIGKWIANVREPPGAPTEKAIYLKDGHETVFNLPPQRLRVPLEALSFGIGKVVDFDAADGAAAGRLANAWMKAMVNAI